MGILVAGWFVIVFGATFLVAGLAIAAVVLAIQGRGFGAGICAALALAFPALHVADVLKGRIVGRPFEEVRTERAAPERPVVLAIDDPGTCGTVCREALARGFAAEIVQTSGPRRISAQRPADIFAHRLSSDGSECAAPTEATRRRSGRLPPPCIVRRTLDALPAIYTRVTSSRTPFPRVREVGFPRLSSDILEGSYFLLIEEVGPDGSRTLAQAFRHIRQPVGWIWGWQLVGGSQKSRQAIGAKPSRDDVLNAVLGWSLVGRMPTEPAPAVRSSTGQRV